MMADELRVGLSELLSKARMGHDTDFLKEGVRVLSQALMEMKVERGTWVRGATSALRDAAGIATATPEEDLGYQSGHGRAFSAPGAGRQLLLPLVVEAARKPINPAIRLPFELQSHQRGGT